MKKILTKLNAKTVNLMGCGGGSIGAIDAMDIASALASCKDELGVAILRYKYAGDLSCKHKILKLLSERLISLAQKENWKTTKDLSIFFRLASGVIVEYCDKHCSKCKGLGNISTRAGLIKECPKCGGTGIYSPSEAERARALKLTRQGYADRWSDRWDQCYSLLTEAECNAEETLRRKLK